MIEHKTKNETDSTIKNLKVELDKKMQKEGAVQKFNDQMKRTRPFLPKTERLLKIPDQQWVSHDNSRD